MKLSYRNRNGHLAVPHFALCAALRDVAMRYSYELTSTNHTAELGKTSFSRQYNRVWCVWRYVFFFVALNAKTEQ